MQQHQLREMQDCL